MKADLFFSMSRGRKLKHWVKECRSLEDLPWVWGKNQTVLLRTLQTLLQSPAEQPLTSLEVFRNPPGTAEARASMFQLMSPKLICISWMRHVSIMFLTCQMRYFIIKYAAGFYAALSKIKKIFFLWDCI